MFQIVLLLSTPLLTLGQTDDPAHFDCDRGGTSNPGVQDECNGYFDVLKECVGQGYNLKDISKVRNFRGAVMCNYYEEGFNRLDEETTASVSFNKSSFNIRKILDQDIKVKLGKLAELEARKEIEAVKEKAEQEIRDVEKWLEGMEQSYLRKLGNMIREMLGKEPLSTPTPLVQPSSTYLTQLQDRTLQTHPPFYTSFTTVFSQFYDQKWWCYLSLIPFLNMMRPEIIRADEHTLASQREAYWFLLEEGQMQVYPEFLYVLVIAYKTCDDGNTFKIIAYHGVRLARNQKGWLLLSYSYTEQNDPTIVDPFVGNPNDQIVVFSAWGSTADPKECANEVGGPGIYRVGEDGSCRGLPVFSRRAAEVEKKCTTRMWEGLELRILSVSLVKEEKYEECVN